MDDDTPPDPAEVAAWLDFLAWRTPDPRSRHLLRYAARYILAGLELAQIELARRLEEDRRDPT